MSDPRISQRPLPVPPLDDYKLKQFRTARAAGDDAGARRWWTELATDNFDRVKALVYLESHDHLAPHEREDAVQKAMIKLLNNMSETFEGTSMGQWINALKTLIRNVCIDVQRREQRHSKRRASLEAVDDAGEETGRIDSEVFKSLEKRRQEEESDEAEALEERRQFLDWGVERLTPKRREVIQLDRDGVPIDEMQERLGVSRDVLYASRSRALKDLCKLREEWPA